MTDARPRRTAGWVVLAATLTLFLAAACSPPAGPDPNGETNGSDDPVVTDPGDGPAGAYHPFTGMPADDPEEFVGRPFMLSIPSDSATRPIQRGLALADVVYEYEAEDEIRRYLAIFHRLPDGVLGPLRSVRIDTVAWRQEWDGIMLHVGGSGEAMQALTQTNAPHLNEIRLGRDPGYFRRQPPPGAPHNLFVRAADVTAYAEQRGLVGTDPTPPRFTFIGRDVSRRGAPLADGLAYRIDLALRHGAVRWELDVATGTYRRYLAGAPHNEGDGTPILKRNLLLLQTRITGRPGDSKLIDIDTTGGGPAWLVRDGAYWQGSWRIGSNGLEVVDADGTPLPLSPGQTWVHWLRTTLTPTITADLPAGDS